MATLGTCFGCAARVNKKDRYVSAVGLIDNHVFELPEGPVAHHALKPLTAPRPAADTIKALHDDDSFRDTRHNVHDFPTDFVVDITLPSRLLALTGSDFIQSALASHALPISLESPPPGLQSSTRPELDDAGTNQGCRFRYPQVYAEELSTITDGRHRGGMADGQLGVPLTISLENAGITISQGKSIHIALGNTKGQPEIVAALAEGEAQDPMVTAADKFVGINTQTDRQAAINGGPRYLFEVPRLALPPVATGHSDGLVDCHASIIRRQAQVTHPLVASSVNLDPARSAVFLSKVETHLDSIGKEVSVGFQELSLAECGL